LRKYAKALLLTAMLGSFGACAGEAGRYQETAADGTAADTTPPAAVHIVAPADGGVVEGPDVTVRLESEGLTIVPAGIEQPHSGHHHLIVDSPLPDLTEPIPSEPGKYIHLGNGQTELVLEGLAPGEHQVIALVGDYRHVPLQPPVADTVRFVVE